MLSFFISQKIFGGTLFLREEIQIFLEEAVAFLTLLALASETTDFYWEGVISPHQEIHFWRSPD